MRQRLAMGSTGPKPSRRMSFHMRSCDSLGEAPS
jgi:hypothetical protein